MIHDTSKQNLHIHSKHIIGVRSANNSCVAAWLKRGDMRPALHDERMLQGFVLFSRAKLDLLVLMKPDAPTTTLDAIVALGKHFEIVACLQCQCLNAVSHMNPPSTPTSNMTMYKNDAEDQHAVCIRLN